MADGIHIEISETVIGQVVTVGDEFDPLSFNMLFVVNKWVQGQIFIFRNTSRDHCQSHSV
jgi:hypothetical protein